MRLESWSSTTNLREKHYFQGSINRGRYVIGYNPQVIPPKLWKTILTLVEQELDKM